MAVVALVTVLYFSLFLVVRAINAGCNCVVFDDTYGKEYGVFTSPNWPVPYEDNIDCLLYTFIGHEEDIVEITFDEFDVQKKELECIYGDYVKLFLHLDEAGVNEQSPWNIVLCGKIADIEQTHYSSGNSLIFEFHSDWQNGNNTGFRGTYRFLSKKLFEIDGELLHASTCDYQFISTNGSRSRGKFYSPQYPSTYPQNTQCAYHFMGKYNEKVTIMFEQVRLQKSDLSCLHSPDVIRVYDGKDGNSQLIGQICNINMFTELVSTGPDLYIEFASESHFPGPGFKATFLFEEDTLNVGGPIEIPSTEPDNGGQKIQPTSSQPAVTMCGSRISSRMSKNGTFTSPNYPGSYPANTHCIYHFSGRGKERVQILFTDFDLYKPDETARDCENIDAVTVSITINGQKERIDSFCGKNKLPAQLMSNGPTMVAEFRSYTSSPDIKGFRAVYRFVTNFGVSAGKPDSKSVCGFSFNASVNTSGVFTSPNWPGYYPRNTECHYFFHAQNNGRVQITFAYFDVEGVTPCTMDTASDYVEFSNSRSVDKKIPRFCGLKKPKVINSEGEYFRMTFKSNDRFDGTGFEAFYQFRNAVDPFTVKRIRSATSSLTSKLSVWFHIVTVISLYFIIHSIERVC
ncbi:suppressor of lurcher protein 1-like [Centruroides vittatus]|uniref:suppressor of lurcher protein 1-like n=1 Tax=Centruroides vittatus TaxID=120091 RepID=UPI00350FE3DF